MRIRDWSVIDVATETILVNLPANDLVSYKLVCKKWQEFIDSPGFISHHFNRRRSKSKSKSLLLHEDTDRSNYLTFQGPFRPVTFFIAPAVKTVGSVNGLICIVDFSSADNIWILNPVTGHILKLPPPSKSPFNLHYESAYFVFWCDGDDGDEEYKLAKIVCKPYNKTAASLWASASPETWTEINVGFNGSYYHPSGFVSGCDIVVGGSAYWIVFTYNVLHGNDVGDLFVMSLDFKTLSLVTIPFSPFFKTPSSICDDFDIGRNSCLFAANWKGNFALVEKDVNMPGKHNVFTMDDNGVTWHTESSFDVDFDIARVFTNINGKLLVSSNRTFYSGITSHDVIVTGEGGLGEGELIDDFSSVALVDSAHDFLGSFVSIKGFKPAQDLSTPPPVISVIWPYPSASGMSGSFSFSKNDKKFSNMTPLDYVPLDQVLS